MKYIDRLLNSITMYRVVMYETVFLLCAATVLGFFGILSYAPQYIIFSVALITVVAYLVNRLFAYVFDAPSNEESVYITAFILALIISPPTSFIDWQFISLAGWAAALAMASKYIFAIHKKHIFNPAAIAVVITAYALDQSASWWVGSSVMFPFILAAGFLVTRKIHRFDLVLSFLAATCTVMIAPVFFGGQIDFTGLQIALLRSPLIFFATVMLTEPLTTPPSRDLRITYGAFVGFLFTPSVHIGSLYFSPELALIVGNVFSYLVSPKQKLVLELQEKIQLSPDVYEFVFAAPQIAHFDAGQYMEWTLAHSGADTRGIRRYFTLSSSPTEKEVLLGVKFYPGGSSYKKKLLGMVPGDTIVASQVAGDFTLPRSRKTKLAFIAGGIGVTPFRSMIKYMIDTNRAQPTTLLLANKKPADVVYQEILADAATKIGLKTIYAFSDKDVHLENITGVVAKLDARTIAQEIPDYKERTFYLSGPRGMVESFQATLKSMGVPRRRIKTDFFPGFA